MRSNGLFATTAALMLLGACSAQNGQVNSEANASAVNGSGSAADASATNATVPAAVASKEEAAKIMHDRHEAMEKIGKATKAAGRELKADSPNLDTIRASAKTINDLAPNVPSLFPAGTGPDVGKTGAKPEIWQNGPDFAAKTSDFQKAAQAFSAAAAGNDLAAIKKSFGDLGGSCKACHDKYRAEMKH
jgi:cytochrome c556